MRSDGERRRLTAVLVAMAVGVVTACTGGGAVDDGADAPVPEVDRVGAGEGESVVIDAAANDADPGDEVLEVAAIIDEGEGGSATVTDDGEIAFTPDPGFRGVVTVAYEVVAEDGDAATGKVEVDVGDTSEAVETTIAWGPCLFPEEGGAREGVEAEFAEVGCATVDVPVDHADPDGDTLEVAVARRPARAPDPIGPLFVNQGGPGMEAIRYSRVFDQNAALDRFDIIGMDPRGTGRSTGLDCGGASYAVGAPVVPAEGEALTAFEAAAVAFSEACHGDPHAAFLGSHQVARDMDLIRDLLGAEQISYHGKSYGSDLGLAYLGLFPERVRAAVLDGATDLRLPLADFLAQQGVAARERLERHLEHCRAEGCGWTQGAEPNEAWAALLDRLRAEPLVDEATGETVTASDLLDWVFDSHDLEDEELDEVLTALARDGQVDEVVGEEDPAWFVDALRTNIAVTCTDTPVDDYRSAAARLTEQVPDTPAGLLQTLALCAAWPDADPVGVPSGAGSGPVLVTATSGDVPTPYPSSVAVAEVLDEASLVTWDAEAHTAYTFSRCVGGLVDALLVELERPPEGASCEDDPTYWLVRDLPEQPSLVDATSG